MVKIIGVVLQAKYPEGLNHKEIVFLKGALMRPTEVRELQDLQINFEPRTFFLTWQGEAETGIAHVETTLTNFEMRRWLKGKDPNSLRVVLDFGREFGLSSLKSRRVINNLTSKNF